MYRALWDRRHEGATRISQCTRREGCSEICACEGMDCWEGFNNLWFHHTNDGRNINMKGRVFELPIPASIHTLGFLVKWRKASNFASATVKIKSPQKMRIKGLEYARDLFRRLQEQIVLLHEEDFHISTNTSASVPCPYRWQHQQNKQGHAHTPSGGKVSSHICICYCGGRHFPAAYPGWYTTHLWRHRWTATTSLVCSVGTSWFRHRHLSVSIHKGCRGACEAGYNIQGPQQMHPTDWQKALVSPSFKSALLTFFFCECLPPEYAQILSGHTLYFALDD